MVCGLEIPLAIMATITAITTMIAGISEIMPFFKKISSNGVAHSIYHLLNKEKCVESLKENQEIK